MFTNTIYYCLLNLLIYICENNYKKKHKIRSFFVYLTNLNAGYGA